jgi:hypothetical protein
MAMFEKFIHYFVKSLFLRMFLTGTAVSLPLGFTTAWLGAAYLSLLIGVDFSQTLFGFVIFGWPSAILPGVILAYPIERLIIRDRAGDSWMWIVGRVLLYMFIGLPAGLGTLISIRTGMQQFPAIVESIYYIQTITGSFVIAILYTLVERVIKEIQKRERKLKTQIEELRIEIDHLKRQKQVDEITNSDFFQDLKEKAANMRQRSVGTT